MSIQYMVKQEAAVKLSEAPDRPQAGHRLSLDEATGAQAKSSSSPPEWERTGVCKPPLPARPQALACTSSSPSRVHGDGLMVAARKPGREPGPCRAKSAPRSLRRALLMPQVHPGSLNRCGKRT